MGKREYSCTPWGMPTFNVFGWQKPCYLLQDGYADTFAELLETTAWENYGTESGNPKCANCMVHSGYEASAVNDLFGSVQGMWQEVKARMFGGYEDASALRLLDEPAKPVHAFSPLVQIDRRWARRRGFERAGIRTRACGLGRSGLAGSCAGNGSREARRDRFHRWPTRKTSARRWSRRSIIAATFRSRGKMEPRLKATFSIAAAAPAGRQFHSIAAERWFSQDKNFLRRDRRAGIYAGAIWLRARVGKTGCGIIGKRRRRARRTFRYSRRSLSRISWQLALSIVSTQHGTAADLN